MASFIGTSTARRASKLWIPIVHYKPENACLQSSQIFIREVRTKAIVRKRIISPTSRTTPEETLPIEYKDPQLSNKSTPTQKFDISAPTTQNTSFNTRIQRGFPPEIGTSPIKKSSTSISSKQDQRPIKQEDDPKHEKFPRKLQAFPFVPGATTSELSKAHKFFLLPAEFVKSATSLSMIPDNTAIPEVAFIGRSNIGKSSLINGLVNRNGLVKTSSKPGHTRMMNFFKIGEKLSLVDMPGYGWKSRDEWGDMIISYLQGRRNLKRIYILVDPSHGLKESDVQIMKLLDGSGLSYQVVLTKMDRLSKTKYSLAKSEIEAQLVKDAICCFPIVLGVSSRTKDGLNELRAAIIKAGQLSL
ncbi:hypothetical protein BGZ49_002658 [Haplosporangium sp. Z 27]|nr:hypothetical protein BGZ49_002658 [Haplosporangium sp. Z 27]